MKLIIEISKDSYEHILKAKSVPEILGIDIVNTVNAVKYGTSLDNIIDEIKAEIENLPTGVKLTDGSIREFTFKNCKKGLLKIIDEKVREE